MTLYHRITIENISEKERADFLEAGVQLPSGVKTRRGAEHITFDIQEDDPRWEKVAALVAPLEMAGKALNHKTTIPYKEVMERLKQLASRGQQTSKLEWLNGYSGQTVEQLLALEGKYRIDSLVLAFEQAISQRATREGNDAFTDEERVVLAVEALEREVNNGGYEQFFTNSSREFVPTIVDSLKRVGCKKTASITQKAINAVGTADLTAEAIEAAMATEDERRAEKLSRCDDAYHKGAEPIAETLFAFIKANSTGIRL